MSQPTQTSAQFLMGGGARSARFENPGDGVRGQICDPPEVRQQTDFVTGEPKFWPAGDPMMQLIVTLQTDLRDDGDDDGKRRIFIKGGSMKTAVSKAIGEAGARDLELGGTLAVVYSGEGEQKQRGLNPPKLYTATYRRPTANFLQPETPAKPAAGPPPAAAAPVAAAPAGPTQQQIDALRAAGIDPTTVFPNANIPPY